MGGTYSMGSSHKPRKTDCMRHIHVWEVVERMAGVSGVEIGDIRQETAKTPVVSTPFKVRRDILHTAVYPHFGSSLIVFIFCNVDSSKLSISLLL